MSDTGWQRLSPRMLLVHPVHEVLNQLPLLIGAIVLGSTTQNPLWSLLGVGLIVALGLTRWFTTSYRIDEQELSLRSGVLHRNELSLPRNRIRSVSTEARLLHRLLGLTVLRVSTGQEAKGESEFRLDAVRAEQVAQLRTVLLGVPDEIDRGDELARWRPSWLRYSPLSLSGLVAVGAAVGMAYQAGFGDRLHGWLVVALLAGSVPLAVGRSLLTFGNLVLTRRADTLHLVHGLVRIREYSYDLRRLRGATLREPLLVRALGGARLDAVMTGVSGAGESSLLLPPCPADTARGVLTQLAGRADVVTGPRRPAGDGCGRWRCRCSPSVRCHSYRRGDGGCGRQAPPLRCSWPRIGFGRWDTGWTPNGWLPAGAASNGIATVCRRPASSAGRCVRAGSSAAPASPPWWQPRQREPNAMC
ncbi:membrane flanked domain-containing protein [Mycolicibacterium neoaurum]|uniref:Membrane flanked domain-containing protein n=1 Tax=Mycolicibacterium neoaurum TaxID=1795 RepID=A0AAV2WEG4_MYCNE|nr:membrane flanked domain-containing protein [Mycolicibacterium neoaurum]